MQMNMLLTTKSLPEIASEKHDRYSIKNTFLGIVISSNGLQLEKMLHL